MKTVVISIKDPASGDLVVVEYSSPRGGCTHVKHEIVGPHERVKASDEGVVTELEDVPGETPRDIAAILAAKINQEWMPEAFEARVKEAGGALIINCTGLVQDAIFRGSVAGAGGTSIEVTEF